MAPLSLKIVLDEGAVTRKVKFDNKITVRAAHAIVREKVIVADPSKEYALFLRSADNELSGIWLEPQRTLDYYMLRDGDSLDYICKVRNLRIKLLDGSVKTMQVDEAKPVSELMMGICSRIGIVNYDEYGLCPEEDEKPDDLKDQPQTGTLTLKKGKRERERDAQLQQLSRKLNTDDNVNWLDQHRTLREQGVEPTATVILKRRLFFSDRNVDARDPVQLNLLYVQTRDAILNGRHLVTEEQAADCKVRWINIRDVHRRILRKSLIGNRARTSKHYKYENELRFMRPFYKDVAPPLMNCGDGDGEERTNEWHVNVVCDADVQQDGSYSDDCEIPVKKTKTKRRKPKLKKRKDSSNDEEEKLNTSSICNDSQPSIVDFDVADPVDSFLLSIGATLKTFSPYHLNIAKSKIFAVVQEHDLQQIVQKERQEQCDVKASTSEGMYIV